MEAEALRKGKVYRYTSPAENIEVVYTGYDFRPEGWGYGFKGYNEETGKCDGHFNTLSRLAVENQIEDAKTSP